LFTIYPNGDIQVMNRFRVKSPAAFPLLMRAGNSFELSTGLSDINYYGRGPGENYWDRKSGSLIGIYKQTVSEQYYPYARPQESGNKTEVRWVSFNNAEGQGLLFVAVDSQLSFSALPYSLDDLDPGVEKKQFHSGELVNRDRIYVHMDYLQTGVGGIDSWGAWPLEKYRVPFRDYEYRYWMVPVR